MRILSLIAWVCKISILENKLDWPFLWGENEYTVGAAASCMFVAKAVEDLYK